MTISTGRTGVLVKLLYVCMKGGIYMERICGGAVPGSDALWHLSDTNFADVAETMGCLGITVKKPEQVECALDQALASGRPTVIDVKSSIDGIAPRAWTP
jgi:thiamine pyrophosphate-dependent acetolactate synthase large subunit-like protein